jgi:hypothetical protein
VVPSTTCPINLMFCGKSGVDIMKREKVRKKIRSLRDFIIAPMPF